jgi:hypothetical protein
MDTRGLRIANAARRYFPLVLWLIASSGLSGCFTAGVLKLRNDREVEIASVNQFRAIAGIRSAWTGEDGVVFACIEFQEARGAIPKSMTVRVADAPKVGRTYGTFRSNPFTAAPEPDDGRLRRLIYPLQETLPGCRSPMDGSGPTIHRIPLPSRNPFLIEDLIVSPEFGNSDSALLFEFTFVDAPSEDVLIVYRPRAEDRRTPFAIAGGFEPRSELVNPYTLLVVPAFGIDLIIVTSAILGGGDPVKLDQNLSRLVFK